MLIWLLFALLPQARADANYWLSAPTEHVALSGDIEVSYRLASPSSDLLLQLVRIVNDEEKPVAKRDVPPKITKGKIVFPCVLFERAGQFAFKLVTLKEENILARTSTLDVEWPEVTVHVPLMVETYSSDVSIQLYVGSLQCQPRGTYIAFIDLVYEGNTITAWNKPTILYTSELIGWMWNRSFEMTLECEFFDRAGNYTVRVRTSLVDAPIVAASDTILVMWSHRYSVSVSKSSVQPCDGGLSVIYHYPRCILDQDRIRVYGKALRGPLKYIRESRIESGKHSTKLSCDIFDDDYQEYCFSFVSTARNGAVFDLKTHCVPVSSDIKGKINVKSSANKIKKSADCSFGEKTSPSSERKNERPFTCDCSENKWPTDCSFGEKLRNCKSLSASWNDWGPWSECSTSCGTGVQSRYRLCLSTSNESLCVGKAVQSQLCNTETCSDDVSTVTEQPTVWDCPCGCERNLTDSILLNLLLSECDSSVWWSIQAWPTGHVIVEATNIVFPSLECWLTIRDGRSSLGTVLAIFNALTRRKAVHSLSSVVRIELHCGNHTFNDIEIICRFTRSEVPRASLAMIRPSRHISDSSNLSAVHITIIMLAAVLSTTIAFLLLVHFFRRYKSKYASDLLNTDCPELHTSISDISEKTPSTCPEDYLYKSFIFRSSTSLQQKLKWDKLPLKVEPSDTSSPVRRRGKASAKTALRESSTPLAASVSELSMTGSEDGFEYDYYDFGCRQEPGSFFCPDPILIGWPPFIPLPPQGAEEFGDYPLQHFTPSPEGS